MILRRLFVFISFIILLLIAGLLFIGSEAGTRTVWNFLTKKYPEQIRAESIQGGLADALHFKKLEIYMPDLDIKIDALDFSWQFSKLLQKELLIDQLKISGLLIDDRRPKPTEEPAPVELQDIELPISISINDFLLSHAEYHTAESEKPLLLDLLSFALHADNEGIKLQRAQAKVPEAELNLSGKLQPKNKYPLNFDLDWSAQVPDQPTIKGMGTISGDLQNVIITQQLLEPANLDLNIQLNNPLSKLNWLADVKFDALQLQQIKPSLPAVIIATQLHAEGNLKDIHLTGNYSINSKEFGDWSGALDIDQSLPTDLNINQLEIISKNTAAKIDLSGNINLENNPDINLHGNWQKLQWPLSGDPLASSAQGELQIVGKPDDFQLKLAAGFNHQQVGDVDLNLKGHGYSQDDKNTFVIESLASNLLDGRIDLTGQLTMSEAIVWDIDLKGSSLNPQRLQKDWPGQLNITSKIVGSKLSNQLNISITNTQINGMLRDYAFHAKTDLKLINNLLDLKQLIVTSGESKLQVSGQAGEQLDLIWDLNSQNLAELYPDASGQIVAHGKVKGPQKQPIIDAEIEANKLTIPNLKIGQLSSHVQVDLAQLEEKSSKGFDIKLNSTEIEFGKNLIDTLDLSSTGSMSAHSINADVNSKQGKLHLVGEGGLKEQQWLGILQELSLEEKQIGHWQLEQPQSLLLSKQQANLEKFCLLQKQATLCLAAQWKESGLWQASSDLKQLPLATLKPFLPEGLVLDSTVAYQLNVSGTGNKNIRANLNLDGPAGSIKLKDAGELSNFEYDKVNLQLVFNEKGAEAELLFDLKHPTASPIKATLKTQAFDPATVDFNKLIIQGQLTTKVDDLAFVQNLTHELEQLKGNLDVDLKLSGTVSKPKIEGHTDLTAEFFLPSAGIHLKQIKLNAISQANKTIAFKGQVQSGEGQLSLTGSVGQAEDGFPIKAEIIGKRFELVNLPEAWVLASPKIKIEKQKNNVNIEGEVSIPEAKLEPVGMESSVPLSSDVVIIADPNKPELLDDKKPSALQISSKVKVILGDKISLVSSGFTGSLKGNLLAVSRPNKPTKGTGKITVYDGKYSAYGQKLTIDKGHIVFAGGPIDSPSLDLKVTRQIEDITAGIYVTGPATSPELELFSKPTMNQDNILSYIMLGKPLSEATSGDGNVLVGAASSLGFKGGAMLTQKIGQGLGLDEFALSGDSKEDAALQIGQYLTPKLYVSYAVGLFEAATQLKLRYNFSKRWSMEAESGTISAMDFLYKIEK